MIPLRHLLLLSLLLGGCAAAPEPSDSPRPAVAAQVRSSAATRAALNTAQAKVDEARRAIPEFTESDSLLKQARNAAADGDNPRAQWLAGEARSRAALALDGYYVTASARELQKLYSVTGLSDEQLAQQRAAEVALLRGDGAKAYAILRKLNKDISSDRKHTVAAGESLWSISARQDVYSNGLLWPLIWDANRDKIKDPNRLFKGQALKIRPNPTVDEVVKAVEYARDRLGPTLRIGEVKEARE